ncbi:DUF982 domain-containing protein [Cereibacter sphaeroides]|uniref:DUF982 domain-containing protein n=1 Tax=Cereibacter sphaeroides TaxID=1063 RepID=UPI0003016DEF|nr:DUF982 domain-containing protein [Cereibacter sphaeroides]
MKLPAFIRTATTCQAARFSSSERTDLIEIHWGEPLSFVVSPEGDVQKFTTIEQAGYWLRRRWPVENDARRRAIHHLEAAMDCVGSVGSARRSFIAAARSAGLVAEDLISQEHRTLS